MAKFEDVVFLSGKRTAFGTFGGTLKDFTATDLAVFAAKAALEQAAVPLEKFGHVIFGNVLQTSKDAIYLARHVGLRAGLDISVPALTVNRLCGSGFQSLVDAARLIETKEAEYVLAGGTESMSQAPHVIRGARWGLALGKSKLEDSLWEALVDTYTGLPMAVTSEKLAKKYGITREDADEYAYTSQMRFAKAQKEGKFDDEIVGIEIKKKKGDTVLFDKDEHNRPNTTLEVLAKLPPVFLKDGIVTAGNASGICDGGAAMVVASLKAAERDGKKPLARLVSYGVSGCDPEIMGIGPVPAIKKALKSAGLTLDQMDLIEVNEAFAPQYLAVEKELELPREKTNVNGGAIAVGHPLGTSGTRITMHLIYELKRRGGRFAVGSACIGGGQGIAVVVENLD